MSPILRMGRGAAGLGAVWSAAWAALFALLSVVVGLVDPPSIDAGEGPLAFGWIGARVGFVSGAFFGVVLAVAERGRGVAQLSLARSALWGALGASALPLLTPMNDSVLLNTIPIGALFAIGTVAAAKRAERAALRDPQSPSSRGIRSANSSI